MRNIWVNSSLPQRPSALHLLPHGLRGLPRLRWLSQWSSLVCFMLIGILIPVLTACMGTNPPLRVGTTAGIVSDNLYLAQELQYYKREAVRLIDYPTADDQLRAFRNRQIDVTAVPLSDALILAQTNPDLKGILVLSRSQGEDVLVANSSITQLSDLAGQRVGVEASSRSRLMLAQALEQAKLSSQDVQVVPISLADQAMAFEQGDVVAVATHEPARSSLLAVGAHDVFPERSLANAMFNVLLVNEETLQKNRHRLADLSRGCLQANDYAAIHQQDVAERLAKRHQLSPEIMTQVTKLVKPFNLADNRRLLQPDDQELQNQVQLIGRQLQQQQLLNGFSMPKLAWDNGIVNQLKG